MEKPNIIKIKKEDIIEAILRDHEALKFYLKILKKNNSYKDNLLAFEQFALMLFAHMDPEEKTLYNFAKNRGAQSLYAYEQEVEHNLVSQFIGEISQTEDKEECMVKIKILSDLVEDHLEQEENNFLPNFEKNTPLQERQLLGKKYLQIQMELNDEMGNFSKNLQFITHSTH